MAAPWAEIFILGPKFILNRSDLGWFYPHHRPGHVRRRRWL